MTADMRYMDYLTDVVSDAVKLIREKTRTYGDSWKRRGGPGAWFTVVRPWDRLEKIVERHGGDVFAAIAEDPSGADGSALGCVRDLMNYMILIESQSRVAAVPPPVRLSDIEWRNATGKCPNCMTPVGEGQIYCSGRCQAARRIVTPEAGSHHAMHADCDECGGSRLVVRAGEHHPCEACRDAGEPSDGAAATTVAATSRAALHARR